MAEKSAIVAFDNLKKALEAQKESFKLVLPRAFPAERMVKLALVAASKNPLLLQCDTKTVALAVMNAAQLHLDPSGILGQAYLVPYYNSKKSKYECQLIPGYRGLIALARRSAEISSIEADVVYKGDKLVYEKGLSAKLEHVPKLDGERNDEDIVGAYCIARFRDGGYHVEFMTRAELEKARRSSKAQSGPWQFFFPEMCRKTVVRRASKYWPMSIEEPITQALAGEDAAESGMGAMEILGDEITVDGEVVDAGEEQAPSKAEEVAAKLRGRRRAAAQVEPDTPIHLDAPVPADDAPKPSPVEDSPKATTAPRKGKAFIGPPAEEPKSHESYDWSDENQWGPMVWRLRKKILELHGDASGAAIYGEILKKYGAADRTQVRIEDRQQFIDELIRAGEV
jgi:recombination protein RecT